MNHIIKQTDYLNKRLKIIALSLTFSLMVLLLPVSYAAYPEHPITLVVPFAAGGPTDKVAKIFAESMKQYLQRDVFIHNKSGAGGTAGTSVVARSAADGYTLLFMNMGFTTAPVFYGEALSYDINNDFEPLGLLINVPMTLVANNELPVNNFKDFRSFLIANKSQLHYAHAGVGSASHLCAGLLMKTLRLEVAAVPYNSTGAAMNALRNNQVDFMCDQISNTLPSIQSNRVKVFGVASIKRLEQLPAVPTLNEQGLKGFQLSVWHGLWAPKGIPASVQATLVSTIQKVLNDSSFKYKIKQLGADIYSKKESSPTALKKIVQANFITWSNLFNPPQ